jgi:predicted PurR-regulated permease PerM
MQLFRGNRSERIDHLITLSPVLAILLIVLAAFALLGDVVLFLGRFKQSIFLFVIGAIIAFILAPLVQRVQLVVRKRWIAVVTSYLMVFLGLLAFAFLLLSPFIQEARGLANNLHNPAAASLKSLDAVSVDLKKLQSALVAQQRQLNSGAPLSQ